VNIINSDKFAKITTQMFNFMPKMPTYRLTGQTTEAGRIMSEAMSEYAGTPEEIRVTVAHADLALARGEVEAALRILEAIKPEQAGSFLYIFCEDQ
jgi:hypothetical protein